MGDDTRETEDHLYRDLQALRKLVDARSQVARGSPEWHALEASEASLTRRIWTRARIAEDDPA
jgi:hypothetical protein